MPSEASTQAETRWRAVVLDWSKSGQDATRFCAERGISRWGFYRWRRRLQAREREPKPDFLPVRVVADVGRVDVRPALGRTGVEVLLRGGIRVRLKRGFDPATLAAAVRTLGGSTC